jgi:hypothetical protein
MLDNHACMNSPSPRRPIGQILIAQGVISEDQLRIALLEQMKSNQPVGKLLVALGFVSEATLARRAGRIAGSQGGRPGQVDHRRRCPPPHTARVSPNAMCFWHLSYSRRDQRLKIAIADPNDIVALDKLRTLIHPGPADRNADRRRIRDRPRHRPVLRSRAFDRRHPSRNRDRRNRLPQPGSASLDEYSQPVVRLVDALLTDAVKHDASDVHFEPEASFLRIRYRIDGILRQIRALHKTYWAAMAVRMKVISGMNIAETRAPQDGRISINISGRAVDFRVASQPTIHGENIVLRILDRQKGIVPLDKLGTRRPADEPDEADGGAPGGHHPGHRSQPAAARPRRSTRCSTTSTKRA